MALKRNNRETFSKVYSLKLKTKDLPSPIFEVKKKNEKGEWEKVDETDIITGTLIQVEPKSFEHKGQNYESVGLWLKDKDELYMLDFLYSFVTQGLFNSLLSLETFGNLEITAYATKPKTPGGKSYPALSLWQSRERVDWKYEKSQLPEVKLVEFKGKKMSDTKELDDFFKEKLTELGKRVKSTSAVVPNPTVATPEPETAPEKPNRDDDVPF